MFNLPEICVDPESVNATLGSTARFFCTAFGPAFVIWTVNGIDVNDPSLNNRGIEAETPSNNSVPINSTLTVNATVENNGTMIQCVAATPVVRSTAAILYIQGMYSNGDKSH